MLFTLGLLSGILIGSGLLALSRKAAPGASDRPAWPRWTALALGVLAVAMFTAGIAGLTDFAAAAVPAIALPVAGVVFGTGRLALGDRRWQTWLGLVLASAPALFWVAFAIGELVGPKH